MTSLLSQLPGIVSRKKKRLGRGLGSGKGAKSGKGTTRHQKARESIPLHFEGGQAKMVKRFPLLRGKGKNKSVRVPPITIAIKDLNIFNDGDVVNIESLQKKGLINNDKKKISVKILANGVLKKKLKVKLLISRSAKLLVEKAGGEVQPV